MVAQKSPIVLLTAVVLMVGGVIVWNASAAPRDPSQIENSESTEVKAKPLSNQQREATSSAIREAVGRGRRSDLVAAEGVPAQPIVMIPKSSSARPVPSDISVGSHWYVEESNSAKIVAEKNRPQNRVSVK